MVKTVIMQTFMYKPALGPRVPIKATVEYVDGVASRLVSVDIGNKTFTFATLMQTEDPFNRQALRSVFPEEWQRFVDNPFERLNAGMGCVVIAEQHDRPVALLTGLVTTKLVDEFMLLVKVSDSWMEVGFKFPTNKRVVVIGDETVTLKVVSVSDAPIVNEDLTEQFIGRLVNYVKRGSPHYPNEVAKAKKVLVDIINRFGV